MMGSEHLDAEIESVIALSCFANLPDEVRARLLERLTLRRFSAGQTIWHPGDREGLHLLVSGQAVVVRQVGDRELPLFDLRPGRILAEWTVAREGPAEIRADTACESLYLSGPHRKELSDESREFRSLLTAQRELAERRVELLDLASRNRFLRVLGRDETVRLIEAGLLVETPRAHSLFLAGQDVQKVHLILRGRVRMTSGNQAFPSMHLERGDLVGETWAVLGQPAPVDAVCLEPVQSLAIPVNAFVQRVSCNPIVERQVLQSSALAVRTPATARKEPGGSLVRVLGADDRIGESTVAFGLAACLQQSGAPPLSVTLVDAQGAAFATRLGVEVRADKVAGVSVRRIAASDRIPLKVLWPEDLQHTRAVVETLIRTRRDGDRHPVVVLSGMKPSSGGADLLDIPSILVVVRAPGGPQPRGVLRREHVRIQAVRIQRGHPQPLGTSRKAVRIPDDEEAVRRFWTTGRVDELTSPSRALGRALARLARMVRGTSVGLALGGGGAFGFAHVGLIRTLEEAGLPIDVVAGVSFGSVVGALYVGAGLSALERLVRDGALLKRMALLDAVLSTEPIGRYIEEATGRIGLEETEVPFYPVGLDLTDGREFVLSEGTLGNAVRSASSMPGLWPPFRWRNHRIVDGGLVNNVPVSTLWEAGADFLLASNCLPANPMVGTTPLQRMLESLIPGGLQRIGRLPGPSGWMGRHPTRLDDAVRALYNVFSQNGRDRACRADHVFETSGRDFDAYAFDRGEEIANAAYEAAKEEMSAILDSYRNDLSRRF